MKRTLEFFGQTNLSRGGSRLPAATAAGLALCAAMQFTPAPVQAQEFRLNVEGAGALFIDEPQSERFGPGFYLAVRPGVALGDLLTLQWSYALLMLGAGDGFDESGTAHSLTTGLRVRPFGGLADDEKQLGGLFVDFNLGYFRTGELDRFGFDTGLGYNFQVAPSFALGPVLRYVHIVQPNDVAGIDPNDAQALALGLNGSFGPAHQEPEIEATEEAQEPLECPTCESCETCEAAPVCEPAESSGCPDYDSDGVCDEDDRCPTQKGTEATEGCPVDPCTGEPIVVLVQFELNSSGMPDHRSSGAQTMDPVLDAVAEAIAQDDSCRVCIVGHSSEDGDSGQNQTLSVARAQAVQDYMTNRGVSESRIPMVGLGDVCSLVPDDTLVMNRRVEFHRLQDGESCPTTCR